MSSDSDSAIHYPPRQKRRRRLLPYRSMFGRPQRPGGAVQHRVHELVAVGRAEAPGELHGLADRGAKRNLGLELELVESDQERGVLDRIEEPGLAVGAPGEACFELRVRAHHSLDERAEVVAVRPRHVLGVGELLYQVLPGTVVQLPAIQRLQGELAGHAARTTELLRGTGARRHSRVRSEAISSAVSIASPPLLPALVAARSSA